MNEANILTFSKAISDAINATNETHPHLEKKDAVVAMAGVIGGMLADAPEDMQTRMMGIVMLAITTSMLYSMGAIVYKQPGEQDAA